MINTGGFQSFVADEQLKLRVAIKPKADGGSLFYRVTNGKVEAEPFEQIALEDAQTTFPAGFTNDGKILYWIDSRGRDTAALIAQDVASGRQTVVAQDPRADIEGTMADPKTGVVQAWSVNYLRDEWTASDPAIGKDLAWLKAQLKGDIAVTSRTDADDLWTVAVDPVTAPSATWIFDRKAHTLKQLFVGRPELVGAPLVPMYPEAIRARDGLTLVSYLTLPAGSDPDGDGKPNRPVPLVLFVHGGPWARDQYGYSSWHQWLANRGYAVLSVNYRGSTGFGKKFISGGDLQWGRKMHDDLLDAVGWAVKRGVTTSDKVAIAGGSYGGYATLAGVAFTPTAFRCGVDIVGPSNLFTLLQTIPPYWEAGKLQFYKRMGDPTTEAGKALLRERSPLFAADKIRVPLLIGQGQNDPRVNVRESQQIVDAMKAKNIPVTYVVFPDEGHGFARPVNNIAFNAITENFLSSCLGGRAEPIGDALKPSSAQVNDGAGQVPGLAAAVAAR
jgi:acetyl esterase/lipase